jgi:hypothetical protein
MNLCLLSVADNTSLTPETPATHVSTKENGRLFSGKQDNGKKKDLKIPTMSDSQSNIHLQHPSIRNCNINFTLTPKVSAYAVFLFICLFFRWLGFELRGCSITLAIPPVHFAPHILEMEVSQTIFPGWPQTLILLISASQVAKDYRYNQRPLFQTAFRHIFLIMNRQPLITW